MKALILFGPSILRPMEAFEVALPLFPSPPSLNASTLATPCVYASSSSSCSSALERLVTMKLLQADLPDGPALKVATKCFLLVQASKDALQQQQQPLPDSASSSFLLPPTPPPPPGFLPAAGFSWPRASYARGMLRVRIEVDFEGEEEMEWQQEAGGEAAATAAGESGEGGEGREGGAWWASTATIAGVSRFSCA